MASDTPSNQPTPESEKDEPETLEQPESPEEGDEPEQEDIEQLREKNAQLQRDYAALKKDYDKHAKAAKKPKSDAKPEPGNDSEIVDWKILNADEIRACGKAYQDEVAFFKSQGIPLTMEVHQRALENAKLRKGLTSKPGNETRQVTTTATEQGEHRPTKPKVGLTESQKKIPGFKEEWLTRYGDDVQRRVKK